MAGSFYYCCSKWRKLLGSIHSVSTFSKQVSHAQQAQPLLEDQRLLRRRQGTDFQLCLQSVWLEGCDTLSSIINTSPLSLRRLDFGDCM